MYLRIFAGTVLFALGGHLTLSFIATSQRVGSTAQRLTSATDTFAPA